MIQMLVFLEWFLLITDEKPFVEKNWIKLIIIDFVVSFFFCIESKMLAYLINKCAFNTSIWSSDYKCSACSRDRYLLFNFVLAPLHSSISFIFLWFKLVESLYHQVCVSIQKFPLIKKIEKHLFWKSVYFWNKHTSTIKYDFLKQIIKIEFSDRK